MQPTDTEQRRRRTLPADLLLATLPVGVITYSVDGQCQSANEAAVELLGVARDVLLSQNFRQIAAWQESGILGHAEQTLQSGPPFQAQMPITSTAGRERCLDWRLRRIELDGDPMLLVVFTEATEPARECTTRQRAEDEIAHLSSFPQSTPWPVLEFARDGGLLYANAAARETAALLEIDDLGLFLPTSTEEFFSHDPSTMHAYHELAIGDRIFAETIHTSPEFESVRIYALDVTERARATDALRLTQLSVDRAADLIHWIDSDGRLLYVSDSNCQRHGYSREELLGMTVFDLDPTMTLRTWPEHWRTVQERGSFTFETVHATKQGELFPIEVTTNFVEYGGKQYNVAYARDITLRRQLEHSLRLTQFSLDRSTDYIFWIGPQGNLLYVNEGTCRRLGYERSEALELTIFDVDPKAPQPWAEHWAQLKAHGSLTFETVHMTKAGKTFPVEVTASYVEFDGQEFDFGLARDISERKQAEEELRNAKEAAERANAELREVQRILELLARTDALTGAMNRRAILERLREEMARAERYGTSLAIAMIDIDHFKDVNDTYGHSAGDQVLREVVARASQALRPYDGLGRFGGEEFIAVLSQASGRQVMRTLERVRLAICSAPIKVSHHEVSVAVSIGADLDSGGCLDDVIRSADAALYRAKAEGRNRVVVSASTHAPEMTSHVRRTD